ncbi:hypothetical protein BHE74_00027807 [Ensete ventricosum]|nr:hypothetical protein GW17_00058594 [Ensete ventricosum]RWW64924.1 hypothetical protein BHE74_00027807 [Ensete ventricosum]
MNWATMSSKIEEVADEVLLCQPVEIGGSELLPTDGVDGAHKVLHPVQDQIKGFRYAKLWLDIADEASTLGEENEDGPLERGAWRHEVSIGIEVAKHVREAENIEVEEGADGKGWGIDDNICYPACEEPLAEVARNKVEGATLVLGDSVEVSAPETEAAGVMGLDFGAPTGVLLLDFGVSTGAVAVSSRPSTVTRRGRGRRDRSRRAGQHCYKKSKRRVEKYQGAAEDGKN